MESGTSYIGGRTPFAETGVMDLAEGRQEMLVDTIIPDDNTSGELEFEVDAAYLIEGPFRRHGPWTADEVIETRFAGKYLRIRVRQETAGDWRFGLPRVRMQGAGWR